MEVDAVDGTHVTEAFAQALDPDHLPNARDASCNRFAVTAIP
jgi:hypothetical protein